MIAQYYRAFRYSHPLISAARALYVARTAAALPAEERAKTVRFDFPDATEAERGSLFRGGPGAVVYWRPSEYTPRGDSVPTGRRPYGAYNPRNNGADWCKGYAHVRYIDGAKRAGLRLVGFADEIAKAEGFPRSIDHTGWITDPYGDCSADNLFRGIVYRLPARDGRSVFAYGYADPVNDGCAVLCFDNDADSLADAARMADQFSERCAEHERDYQTREIASMRADECRTAVKELRAEMREIRAELKAARARCKRFPSAERPRALVRAVKAQLETMRQSVTDYRAEIERLADDPFSVIRH